MRSFDGAARVIDRLVAAADPTRLGLLGGAACRIGQGRAALKNGERYLEVGVGSGVGFLSMVRANPDGASDGLDPSAAMIARCRRRLERAGVAACRLQQSAPGSLPLDDEQVDVAMSCYLFHTLADHEATALLGELQRVMREGGRLVLVDTPREPGALARRVRRSGFVDVSFLPYRHGLLRTEVIRAVRLTGHPFDLDPTG